MKIASLRVNAARGCAVSRWFGATAVTAATGREADLPAADICGLPVDARNAKPGEQVDAGSLLHMGSCRWCFISQAPLMQLRWKLQPDAVALRYSWRPCAALPGAVLRTERRSRQTSSSASA